MKKVILFSAVTCSVAFYACKKDINNVTETLPAVIDTTYTSAGPAIDPVALAASVTVGYGTSVQGAMPEATSGTQAPVLNTDGYENLTYYAINNRYVVIYPHSVSGDVSGYYVTINGSGSYFKVTYPAVVPSTDGRVKTKHKTGLRDDDDQRIDSAIVIKLPVGLKSDTFSLKYAAYDASNRVSNPVSAIVKVVSSKTTDDALLNGNWSVFAFNYAYNGTWDTAKYKADTSYYGFNCVNDRVEWCYNGNCTYQLPYHIGGTTRDEIAFGANNLATFTYAYINENINTSASKCGETPIYDSNGRTDVTPGGYSYNDSSKVLTIIYDGNGIAGDDVSNLFAEKYKVVERNADKLIISYSSVDNPDNGALRASSQRDSHVYITYTELHKK